MRLGRDCASRETRDMKRPLVLATALLALLVVAAPSGAQTKLQGTVGPGFTISLTKDGKRVTSLPAGRYAITVDDKATMHDFVLRGPGVDRELTGLNFVGRRTATVTLRKGSYTFFCSPHPTMKGSFTVR